MIRKWILNFKKLFCIFATGIKKKLYNIWGKIQQIQLFGGVKQIEEIQPWKKNSKWGTRAFIDVWSVGLFHHFFNHIFVYNFAALHTLSTHSALLKNA